MKKGFLFLAILILSLAGNGFGCTPPVPVIEANANPTSISLPVVWFDGSASLNYNSNSLFQWNFGDNSPIDTGLDPKHTYSDTGTFRATLTITDSAGCSGTDSISVIILPLLVPSNNFTFFLQSELQLVIISSLQGEYNFQLWSLQGKMVYNHLVNFTSLYGELYQVSVPIPLLSQGVYFASISSGSFHFSNKIFIQ